MTIPRYKIIISGTLTHKLEIKAEPDSSGSWCKASEVEKELASIRKENLDHLIKRIKLERESWIKHLNSLRWNAIKK